VQREPPHIDGGKLTHNTSSANSSRGGQQLSGVVIFLLQEGLLQANSWWLDNSVIPDALEV
jgi:hypothetical protein